MDHKRKERGNYFPIYDEFTQYQINKLIFQYEDIFSKMVNKEITREQFEHIRKEIFQEKTKLVEGVNPVDHIEDYTFQQRMQDQEFLKTLFENLVDIEVEDDILGEDDLNWLDEISEIDQELDLY